MIAGTHKLGPAQGKMFIHTSRSGIAAKAGHDLTIEVTRWEATLTIDDGASSGSLTGSVDPASFEIREGSDGVKPLTDSDRVDIKGTIARTILQSDRHPQITFSSNSVSVVGSSVQVTGELSLVGVSRPIAFPVTIGGGAGSEVLATTVTINQPDFSIKPYSAMMGALKVAPKVRVEVEARL